jgi:hypothetical protein
LTTVKQADTEGRVHDLIEGHLVCIGHDLFDGISAGAGLDGKHIAHNEEHQFAFRTPGRMKASPPRFVKALKGLEESFNTVRGTRIGVVSQGRFQEVPPV